MKLPSGITWKTVREVGSLGSYKITWKLVDPYIHQCTKPGDLSALAEYLRISMKAMMARHRYLGLGTPRKGRPRATTPTSRQLEIAAVVATKGTTEAAQELGLQVNTVRSTMHKVKKRTIDELIQNQCPRCQGSGVEVGYEPIGARADQRVLPRMGFIGHVCQNCSGDGYVDK